MTVAPHAGAWIEIACRVEADHAQRGVAPHAGAWIEIVRWVSLAIPVWSLPMRERGLKFDAAQKAVM